MEHNIQRTSLSISDAAHVRNLYYKNEQPLEQYLSKLLWWNRKINLVSRDVSRETLRKHIEHSLVLSVSELFKNTQKIMDSGTGGGLPGLPLAIVFPAKQIILNDIVAKKIMACKHIANVLKLSNVSTCAGSVEKMEFDSDALLTSKHAFKINDLIGMVGKKAWTGIILLKGIDEIENELEGVSMKLGVHIIELESGFKDPFYSGKALVEIKRKVDNE